MRFQEYSDDIFSKELPTITSAVSPLSEGTIHDFYSNGDYWWPDPDKENGLPYVRRDGETNPENFNSHRYILREMVNDVEVLYARYVENGDMRCIERIEAMLDCFFVAPETRMNPSLEHAQAIPGVCDGRCIGIIDTAHLVDIPFIVLKMHDDGLLSDGIFKSVSEWFSEYCHWILESDLGREELAKHNNHSIAAYLQVAAFAMLAPDRDEIHDGCARVFLDRLLLQMAPDGGFPRELARTKPYSYSCFTLDIIVALGVILSGRHPEIPDAVVDGRSLKLALEFMLPNVIDKGNWKYPVDVEHFDEFPSRMSFMYFGSTHFGMEQYGKLWHELSWPADTLGEIARNTIVKVPELLADVVHMHR